MTGAVITAFVAYWRRNPLQLVTLIGGLMLATALWSGVQAINAEARASYGAAERMLAQGQLDRLVARDGGEVTLAEFARLRRAGWPVSPLIEGELDVDGRQLRLIGLEPLTLEGRVGPGEIGERVPITDLLQGGVFFAAPGEALGLEGLLSGRVVTSDDVAPGSLVTDIAQAARVLGRADGVDALIVLSERAGADSDLARLAPRLIRKEGQGAGDVSRLTASFHLNLTAFGALSFIVGLFIVQSTIGLAFESRKGMLRSLRLLGVPKRLLLWLMGGELLVLALLAGALGLVLGLVLASALMPDVALSLRGLYGAPVASSVELRAAWVLPGLGMAVLGTVIAGAGAMWRLWHLSALNTGRAEISALQAAAVQRRLAGLGLLLLLVAALLAARGTGLGAGFGALACGLIGAALLLPVSLAWLLGQAAARARRPIVQWMLADTRHMLPGLRLALMALLLAMAANVGVSTMVSSFRLTFTGFLDQRLAADLYVSASEHHAASLDAMLSDLGQEVQPILHADFRFAGAPLDVLGVRLGDRYRETWRFLAATGDPWAALASGDGVFVNEQLAYRQGISLGDRIDVAGLSGAQVVAIVADYGNTEGQVVLSEARFVELFPETRPQGFGVITFQPEALAEQLVTAQGLAQADLTDQAALKAASIRIFERTFAVTGALSVLTLSVAAFALLMSLMSLASMRLTAVAPLWAMGLSQRAIGGLEVVRLGLLALITGMAALPLGLALSWVLLNIVNVAAFGWRLPMYLFPLAYAELFAMMIAAAVLAAWIPARRLARSSPARLLGVFGRDA